jgi:hypothetical protein
MDQLSILTKKLSDPRLATVIRIFTKKLLGSYIRSLRRKLLKNRNVLKVWSSKLLRERPRGGKGLRITALTELEHFKI